MKYLIASIVGAIIGYITNWLAIKMLFRPHEEKRFLGIKLPFTPGLIPKERHRIANSVGETVGTHLLTKDTLVEALSSDKIEKQLRARIEKLVKDIENSELTLEDIVKKFTADNYNLLINDTRIAITASLINNLKTQEIRDRLNSIIFNNIEKELNISTESFLENKYIKELQDSILYKCTEFKDSEHFKEKVKLYIEDKFDEFKNADMSIEEILPPRIFAAVKVYIYNSRADICEAIRELLKQPDTEARVKQVISNMISSNLSPLVSMFINPDTVYGKLMPAFDEYLKEDENQRNTVLLINQSLDKLIKNKISELLLKFGDDEREEGIEAVTELITDKILNNEFISDITFDITKHIKSFTSVHELISSVDNEYLMKLENFLSDKLDNILKSDIFIDNISHLVDKFIKDLLDIKVKAIFNHKSNVLPIISNNLEALVKTFIENEVPSIIEVIDIPKIVEKQINSFDVTFAEKIIIGIANKELNAITWLGALLGAIIGILSPILDSLY